MSQFPRSIFTQEQEIQIAGLYSESASQCLPSLPRCLKSQMHDATQILNQIEAGDPFAADKLLPLVYEELRKLAAVRLAHENPGQTLQSQNS